MAGPLRPQFGSVSGARVLDIPARVVRDRVAVERENVAVCMDARFGMFGLIAPAVAINALVKTQQGDRNLRKMRVVARIRWPALPLSTDLASIARVPILQLRPQ